MKRKLRSFCCSIVACVPLAAQAEAYKWIDADGKVHYSQEKPAGRSADTLQLRKSALPPTAVPSKDKAKSAAKPTVVAKPTPSVAPTLTPEAREARCQQAKSHFAGLESTPRVFREEANGERVRLTEEERQEALAREKGDIDNYCQP